VGWNGTRLVAGGAALVAALASVGGGVVEAAAAPRPAPSVQGRARPPASAPTATSIPASGSSGAVGPSPSSDAGAPSFAPGASFPDDQQWLETAVSDRLAKVGDLTGAIGASKALSTGDRSALTTLVGNAGSVLQSVSASLANDTTLAQLRTAANLVISSLHVYAILTPQVQMTIDADAVTAAAGRLQSLEPGLDTAIAAAHATRRNLFRLHQLDQRFVSDLNAASGATSPLPGQLLQLSGADLGAATPVITQAGAALAGAHTDMSDATATLREIVNLLSKPGVSSSSSVKRLRASVRQP